MRILLDYRPALRQRTGVGEYVHELAAALVQSAPAGEDLSLFSASWRDRLSPGAVAGAAVIDRRIPVRLLNLAWHRWERPAVETITGRAFDVVHSTHPLLMPSTQAAQVITVYDLDFLDHPERTRAEIRRDYPPLARLHAQRADHVVVISKHTHDDVVARLGVPETKISICMPGAPAWPARNEEPAGGCILFLGTLEPRKNLGVLLEAYARVLARRTDAPPLVLAGRATPEAREWVARCQQPPLNGHVELPGYIEPGAREALFRRAILFVLPSHTEGFGMPAVEAMTIGVPVIAADRGALKEAVGAAGRLVSPDDAGGLADAIDSLLDSPALRRQMREAGLAQARRFQWRDTAAGVRGAWTRAVEHRKTRGG